MARYDSHGGAAAAVADLQRARESFGAVDPMRARNDAASAVFRDAEVLLKSLRTYTPDHPRVADFLSRMSASMERFLVEVGDLEVSLYPRAIVSEAGVIYEASRIENNPWFPLYADGLRQLTFQFGMTDAEIRAFFSVLQQSLDKSESEVEFDAVTLLWEKDLPHVRFESVDSFVEGAGGEEDINRLEMLDELVARCSKIELSGEELAGSAYARGERVRRTRGGLRTREELAFLRHENLAVLTSIPGDAGAVSYRVLGIEPEDIAALAERCRGESSVVGRYFEAMVATIGEHRSGPAADALLSAMRQLCRLLIEKGELTMVHEVLTVIGRSVSGGSALAEELIDDASVASLVDTLVANANTYLEEDALQLIGMLAPGHASALLSNLSRVTDDALRAKLFTAAGRWGASTARAAGELLLTTSNVAFGRELIKLLGRLDGGVGAAALDAACWSGNAELRPEALRAFFESAPLAESAKRAERGLRSGNAPIRRLSLEFLVRLNDRRAVSWIRARIEDDGFGELELTERKRLYLAYAQVGGEGVGPRLLEQLGQRNTLGRAKVDEERMLAAWALGHLRFGEAKPVLEQIRAGRMTRAALKDACREALAVIDSPPPAKPRALQDPAASRGAR